MMGQASSDEDRVLREQLRLVFQNTRSSFPTALGVLLVMPWSLWQSERGAGLLTWAAVTLLIRLACQWQAKHWLERDLVGAPAKRVAQHLLGLSLLMGAGWSSIIWLALEPSDFANAVMIHLLLIAAGAGSMVLLAPFFPAFLATIGMEVLVVLLKYLDLGGSFLLFCPVLVLYGGSLLLQGRNLSRATKAAIALRFENLELLQRLQLETEHARAAELAAESANQAKTKFLAAASHDLRQPQHALGLFLAVLARGELAAAQRGVLEQARCVADASAAMLNNLLDLSRLEAGAVQAQRRPFKLQTLLHEAEIEWAPQANAKGLVFRLREIELVVDSDPALVAQMLRNLLGNAIRYTSQGGLLLACRQRDGLLWLEVWDSGIGIAEDKQAEVFREFHQLGNPERDREQGMGLGLAIVAGLARRLGHPLELRSRPGRGSVFRLGLPLASAPPEPAVAAAPASLPRPGLRVLVIDDDAAVRAGMEALLGQWSCQCESAESLTEALPIARRLRPELIISDYRLRAERTGAEAVLAIRADLGWEVPALLITGDTAPERWREAMSHGIPLLHKPVSADLLQQHLTG